MYLGKAGQKSYSAHLGQNGGFNFITSCDEVNFRVPCATVRLNSCHGGEGTVSVKGWGWEELRGPEESPSRGGSSRAPNKSGPEWLGPLGLVTLSLLAAPGKPQLVWSCRVPQDRNVLSGRPQP